MKKDEIHSLAIKRMSRAIDADQRNREAALNDVKFLTGDQWDEEDRRTREAESKPCLTINRMPQFVRQVTGDIRNMNPAIKVIPADDSATPETAEILRGMIRNIEYLSGATDVYENAAECAAQSGLGAFRVVAEYESDSSFNQELWIKRIANPFSVYFDPDAVEPTRSDAGFVFITETMSSEDFKEEYPDAYAVDFDRDEITEGQEKWRDGDDVVIAEYYWKEPETFKIGLLPDGRVIKKPTAAHNVVKTRETTVNKVKWAKVSGKEILEGPRDIPCKHIPVIAVTGEEINVGGEVVRSSVIRYAKDSQRLYNFWSSIDAEVTALQPKAPFLVTAEQVKGLTALWNTANSKNRPYLVYNPDPKAPGAPQRVPPPVPSSALAQGALKAAEDMKATTGIYDAGLGNQSNEKSGVAIRQRQMESDISNSIYSDNLAKAIEHCGRVLVDMIPKVYDTDRTVRVLGDDDQESLERVNGMMMSLEGPVPVNQLDVGRFDVRVTVGPNYTTRRQETAESMMQFVQAFPAAGQVAGDLIAKSMDWPDADKLAERLKKVLPPGVIPMDELSPEEQQAMQQQQMQQQAMAQKAEAAEQIEFRKADAEASEAESDAEKASYEAIEKKMELALASGQMNAVIGQIVQSEVARALQGVMVPRGMT